MTSIQYYSISSSFASGAYGCNITPMNFSNSMNVLFTTNNVTISSATASTFNFPLTFFGFAYSKFIITDVAIRLISGSAGGLSNIGVSLSGSTLFSGKTLPTSLSSDLCIVNCSVQDASVIKTGNPGDPVTISPGGLVTGTGIYQFDFIGYYIE